MKIFLNLFLISLNLFAIDDKKTKSANADEEKLKYNINYTILKDTLFTTGDYFIEVNLTNQMAYLHSRFDSTKSFAVSTGTKRLKDGI